MWYIKTIILFLLLIYNLTSQTILKLESSHHKIPFYISNDTNNDIKFIPCLVITNSFFSFPYWINNSPISKVVNISIRKNELLCNEVKKDFHYKNSNLNFSLYNFTLYYHSKSVKFIPLLAMAYKVNKNSSIVYQSYEQGLIKKKSFGIYLKGINKEYLYLGGIPENFIGQNYISCKVNSNYINWGCNLTSITFLSHEYFTNEYIYFDYNWKISSVSKAFYLYITHKVNETLHSNQTLNQTYYPIKFRFKDKRISIENKIKLMKNKTFVLFISNNFDCFVFCTDVFENNLVYFDYDNNKVIIIGNKSIEFIPYKEHLYLLLQILILCNLIILLIGDLYIVSILYLNKFNKI